MCKSVCVDVSVYMKNLHKCMYYISPKKGSPRSMLYKVTHCIDMFRPTPGLISCASMTGRWRLLSHARNAVRCLLIVSQGSVSLRSVSRQCLFAQRLKAVSLCAASQGSVSLRSDSGQSLCAASQGSVSLRSDSRQCLFAQRLRAVSLCAASQGSVSLRNDSRQCLFAQRLRAVSLCAAVLLTFENGCYKQYAVLKIRLEIRTCLDLQFTQHNTLASCKQYMFGPPVHTA